MRTPARSRVLLLLLFFAACSRPAPRRLELVDMPAAGEVAKAVKAELARSGRDGRRVLVYVGASWCEPCQRFHHAAEAGELDALFPTLRLLVFDADRDGARLAAAGYTSQYIPLFAVPAADGRGTGRQIEGSVKGDAAVQQIAPRLAQLLGP